MEREKNGDGYLERVLFPKDLKGVASLFLDLGAALDVTNKRESYITILKYFKQVHACFRSKAPL